MSVLKTPEEQLKDSGLLAPPKVVGTRPVLPWLVSSRQWIVQNRDQYAGQWIVLSGDVLLAHGKSVQEVLSGVENRENVYLTFVA
jgi:hypothetical protein